MRDVSSALADKLDTQLQTIDNNANPDTFLRISRPIVPLKYADFIERTRIVKASGIQDSDIAVCHPRFDRQDEDIWVAYVRNDTLHIKYARNCEVLSKSDWFNYNFTDTADKCAIAFDSTIKHNAQGIWEFITERLPWVFWTQAGALYGKKLGTEDIVELANANVTDVSAVRGPIGELGNWDMGLTVFFVMSGSLYYRQLIGGVWYDTELVQHDGLTGLTYEEIKAFVTWDYHVGVQILTDDGKIYVLLSYYEGIGIHSNSEHTMFDIIDDSIGIGKLKYVGDSYFKNDEHTVFNIDRYNAYNYSIHTEVPRRAYNIKDINGNWGSTIEVYMSEACSGALNTTFSLVDGNGTSFTCVGVEYDERIIRLVFEDFNEASGNLTVAYTSNSGLTTPIADVDGFSVTFTPEHLGEYVPPVPKVSSAANIDDRTIIVYFDRDIYNASTDISSYMTVYSYKYPFYPDYPTSSTVRTNLTIASTQDVSGNNRAVQINLTDSLKGAIGSVGILYDGMGGLNGENGYVEAFDETFTPAGLDWFAYPNDAEHTQFDIDAQSVEIGTLTRIYYQNVKSSDEHTEFDVDDTSITLGTLTYVGPV